jgi:hypothetical protein
MEARIANPHYPRYLDVNLKRQKKALSKLTQRLFYLWIPTSVQRMARIYNPCHVI